MSFNLGGKIRAGMHLSASEAGFASHHERNDGLICVQSAGKFPQAMKKQNALSQTGHTSDSGHLGATESS